MLNFSHFVDFFHLVILEIVLLHLVQVEEAKEEALVICLDVHTEEVLAFGEHQVETFDQLEVCVHFHDS